jgi:nitrous oxide reductase
MSEDTRSMSFFVAGENHLMPNFSSRNRVAVSDPISRLFKSLKATDVIHSFWIPSLAGKMDMIPGRTNTLSLTATRAGTYRATCAEFCRASHALMMKIGWFHDYDGEGSSAANVAARS